MRYPAATFIAFIILVAMLLSGGAGYAGEAGMPELQSGLELVSYIFFGVGAVSTVYVLADRYVF